MTLPFYRVSGSGNDFLALIEPDVAPPPERVRAWCRRGLSLGADGVFALRRLPPGTGGDAAVAMDYANADGSPAALCLNGTRCAARLAFELGWAGDGDRVTVETGAGALACRRLGGSRIAVEAPPPEEPPEPVEAQVEDRFGDRIGAETGAAGAPGPRTVRGFRVVVGVPHLVVPWSETLATAPVGSLGAALRRHPAAGPAGANVDFVRFPEPGRMEIRTFERGVEAETLACGTGVLAGAAVGVALGRAALPLTAITLGGFELGVDGPQVPGGIRRWELAGDARIVARGEILDEAAELPAAPSWSA
jgi:diaminopimelate epimerase